MKSEPSGNLVSKLRRISEQLEEFATGESKASVLKNLDYLIAAMNRFRGALLAQAFEEKTATIQKSLGEVIGFLEFAKSDEFLRTVLLSAEKGSKPKRQPIDIPNDLTNEQIRSLLERNLSKPELKAIATQRSISVGKASIEEIKRDILKHMEREDGYERLGGAR
jgi:hypothetical protein